MRGRMQLNSRRFRVFATLLALGLLAGRAHADVALLKNGRTLSVSGYRVEGDRLILVMEGGGQITLPNEQVLAIRREPVAVLSAPSAVAPAPPAASADRASLQAPVSLAPGVPDGPDQTDRPISIDPAGVFDREALRGVAARIARKHS